MNTYKKMRDGSWGVLAKGPKPTGSSRVTVLTKSGARKSEIIDRVIWSSSDGQTHIATLRKKSSGGGTGCSSCDEAGRDCCIRGAACDF